MLDFHEKEHSKNEFTVIITDEEWNEFSHDNKIRLLYRLRRSGTDLAKSLAKTLSIKIEDEQQQLEIDFVETFANYYKDVK